MKLRKEKGSRASRRLRNEGLVPAILYGHGEKCVDLVATREAVHAAVRHGSRIVELKGAVKTSALIRELQWDTFGVEPVHVDFLR
ncbi:MAG: 50S ribosomal protein L25, partial [Planctomycetia bacterium]|nr:50S ribosomal protein L25 [Planctomycetia bacterium]